MGGECLPKEMGFTIGSLEEARKLIGKMVLVSNMFGFNSLVVVREVIPPHLPSQICLLAGETRNVQITPTSIIHLQP